MADGMSQIEQLSAPLSEADVECRIGTTSAGGFSLLLYKTSRVDVKRLNSVFGLEWSNEFFYDDKQLLCCNISVYDGEKWIKRTGVGTASRTEKEKGAYSDALKRAGFRWGIGIELYSAPFIWIKWNMTKTGDKHKPDNFYSSDVSISQYDVNEETGEISVEIKHKGNVIYSYGPTKNGEHEDNEKEGCATPRQIQELKAGLKDTGANEAKFLEFIAAKSFENITTEQYQVGMTAIDTKRGNK
jgi:hypothetical protein